MKKLFVLFALALLLCSCSNSMKRFEVLNKAYNEQGYDAAINEIQTNKDDLYGEKSMFLYYYDLGILYHYNQNFENSIGAFNRARQIYDDLYARSVTNEAASMITNDNTRPYRAKPFEILFLSEMQILNYLALNDIDGALVEVRQAQIIAEQLYMKDDKKVNDNGFLRYLTALVYEMQGEKDDAAIAYYETVKAYETGNTPLPKEVFSYASDRLLASGREDDFQSFKNKEPAPRLQETSPDDGEIVFIAYKGRSPVLKNVIYAGTFVGGIFTFAVDDETMKGLDGFVVPFPTEALDALLKPLGVTTLMIPTVFIAVPKMADVVTVEKGTYNDVGIKQVEIQASNGKVYKPELVYDGYAELKQNVDDESSANMVRSVSQTLIKAAPLILANKKATEAAGVLGGLAARLAGDASLRALAQSDTRVGSFNPRHVVMTRLPVKPGSYQFDVRGLDKSGRAVKSSKISVPVERGQKKVVLVPMVY
ncbi:MAG: hypothetical protein HUK20_09395 [Fibrobacter sp.]|nr:hypothetical protein [Fibrobacter sp.]